MSVNAMETRTQAQVRFAPSRLGHANMFVGGLESSIEWYQRVAGIELVRREPTIYAGFHSNGNTHHDIGLMQTKDGATLGINGFQQPSSFRGLRPGLNHFGWEMPSERALIAALDRGKAAGLQVVNYANHQISHSAYVPDPEGNYHEFYADIVEHWRTIFNLEREELVTERWHWEKSAPGMEAMPIDPKDRRRVDDALFHPRRITHSTLVAENMTAIGGFLTEVAGLTLVASGDGVSIYRAGQSDRALVLVDARHGWKKGLIAISFLVEDEADLRQSIARAPERGVTPLAVFDNASKLSFLAKDPDGLIVEFYTPRGSNRGLPSRGKQDGNLWVLSA